LPKASFIGFTGTPIESGDMNTQAEQKKVKSKAGKNTSAARAAPFEQGLSSAAVRPPTIYQRLNLLNIEQNGRFLPLHKVKRLNRSTKTPSTL
jgi:hypothetical protein